MLNEKLINIIKSFGFNVDDLLIYFVSLYYNITPSYIPELVKKQANITGIVQRDYENGTIIWVVPLFISEPLQQTLPPIESQWEWVNTEYRTLFMDIKGTAGGDKKGCTVKMKKFFAENPEVRKDEVIQAAKLYLEEFASGKNDPRYMQRADYFISKVVATTGGSSSQSRLSQFLEIISVNKVSTTTVSNRLTRGLL